MVRRGDDRVERAGARDAGRTDRAEPARECPVDVTCASGRSGSPVRLLGRLSVGAGVVAASVPAAACLAVLCALLPWSTVGSTERSGFALASAARSAGVLTGLAGAVAVLLDGLPVVAGLACAAMLLGRRRAAAALSVAAAMILVVASLVVLREGRGVSIGPWLGVACGPVLAVVAAIGGSGWSARGTRR